MVTSSIPSVPAAGALRRLRVHNSVESVAYEDSRYNDNATNFYAADPYRSSDHDPLLVGFDLPAPPTTTGQHRARHPASRAAPGR